MAPSLPVGWTNGLALKHPLIIPPLPRDSTQCPWGQGAPQADLPGALQLWVDSEGLSRTPGLGDPAPSFLPLPQPPSNLLLKPQLSNSLPLPDLSASACSSPAHPCKPRSSTGHPSPSCLTSAWSPHPALPPSIHTAVVAPTGCEQTGSPDLHLPRAVGDPDELSQAVMAAEAASYWQEEGHPSGGWDRLPATSLLPPNRPTDLPEPPRMGYRMKPIQLPTQDIPEHSK